MAIRQPRISIVRNELIIRIPLNAMALDRASASARKRRLTVRDVVELVEAGRLAHRLGKTRSVRSLKELDS